MVYKALNNSLTISPATHSLAHSAPYVAASLPLLKFVWNVPVSGTLCLCLLGVKHGFHIFWHGLLSSLLLVCANVSLS